MKKCIVSVRVSPFLRVVMVMVMDSKKTTAFPSAPCAGSAATRGAVLPDGVPVLRRRKKLIYRPTKHPF